MTPNFPSNLIGRAIPALDYVVLGRSQPFGSRQMNPGRQNSASPSPLNHFIRSPTHQPCALSSLPSLRWLRNTLILGNGASAIEKEVTGVWHRGRGRKADYYYYYYYHYQSSCSSVPSHHRWRQSPIVLPPFLTL